MFPCPMCSTSAGEQVREMVDNLSGSEYGQIWLDVEVRKYISVHVCTCACVVVQVYIQYYVRVQSVYFSAIAEWCM